MRAALADNRRFLLKIHGDGEERTGRVLTKGEYDAHYGAGDPSGLRAQLELLFRRRRLMFLGCSLVQDRTMDVLLESVGPADGVEHYAVLVRPKTDAELSAKQRFLGERGIQVIWLPAGRYDLIATVLRRLAPEPDLVLIRPEQRKAPLRSELDLLIPYQRTTAFVGRDAELATLHEWVLSDAPVSVQVVTGVGGAGKTRLAIELLSLEELAGWHTGFLTAAEVTRFSGLHSLSKWLRRKPVLAVVDYAAGMGAVLRTWLEGLAAAEAGGCAFRLLLLEREADFDSGWLEKLAAVSFSAGGVRGLFASSEPLRLHAIADLAYRREVLRATVAAGAGFRGVAAPVVVEDAWFAARLAEPVFGDPLVVMMAGLTALDTGVVGAMALGRVDLAIHLARRERERIVGMGGACPAGLMAHMAAYVTVCGELTWEELRAAAKAETAAIGIFHAEGWGTLAHLVRQTMARDGVISGVLPDVVGEAFLLLIWGEDSMGAECVVRAARLKARPVAATVMRTAQDFCGGDPQRKEPLSWVDALIESGRRDWTLLREIENALPKDTVVLREQAVKVLWHLVEGIRDKGFAQEIGSTEFARVLINLGFRLAEIGDREKAAVATEEAVSIFRRLAEERPDLFLHDLAMALNNLGATHDALGRREKALTAMESAVLIRRRLTAASSVKSGPELAAATGRCRREAGSGEEALAELATSLSNVGAMLSKLGRREKALATAHEAVAIFRQLADRWDVFMKDLASGLTNLGTRYHELGLEAEALAATVEAVGIYRRLAAVEPDGFLPVLAVALNNLGNCYDELEQSEEALAATEESVNLRRLLAESHPAAFLPELASSLNNLSVRFSVLDRPKDSLAATMEAVSYYRQFAVTRPEAFLPILASALSNLGVALNNVGEQERALAASEEAILILRPLASERPDAFLPNLASSLGSYGMALRTADRNADAAAAFYEGLQLLEPVFLRHPQAFRGLMRGLASAFVATVEAGGGELDTALLERLLPYLQSDAE